MGNCKYCGKSAGFLRGKHPECEQKYLNGKCEIVDAISQGASDSGSMDSLQDRVIQIARHSFISDPERRELLLQGWISAADRCLEDGIIEESQERRLVQLKECLSLSKDDLDKNGAFTRVVKSAVIRDVLSGVIPKRLSIEATLPINFQKGEQIVWAFPRSHYLEDKTRRQYVGATQGVSLRIMKGVYYRIGAFKGQAVDHTERVIIDTGWVVVTNKNIYFAGPMKSFRIPYTKIVSFQPFSDGVGVVRDTESAKPQIFVTGEGWFIYNLITNLAQL